MKEQQLHSANSVCGLRGGICNFCRDNPRRLLRGGETWECSKEGGGRQLRKVGVKGEVLHIKTKLISCLNARGCELCVPIQWVVCNVVQISHGSKKQWAVMLRLGCCYCPC